MNFLPSVQCPRCRLGAATEYRRLLGGGAVYTARCHGKEASATVSAADVRRGAGDELSSYVVTRLESDLADGGDFCANPNQPDCDHEAGRVCGGCYEDALRDTESALAAAEALEARYVAGIRHAMRVVHALHSTLPDGETVPRASADAMALAFEGALLAMLGEVES